MRQRTLLALSVLLDPQIVILDESTTALDILTQRAVIEVLKEMQKRLNISIIFISHDLALAKYFAWNGRIAVMYLGRIVEIGDTPEIINNPQHPYTKVLLSAIPEPDPNRIRSKEQIVLRSEDIPRLTGLPPGCAFPLPLVCRGRVRCAYPTTQIAPRSVKYQSGRLYPAN